jgi:heat shock protein HslJ
MRASITRLALALPLLGCAAQAPATDLVPSPLAGATWRVMTIDGKPLAAPPKGDDGEVRYPSFAFGHRGYGGSAGCNALGGLYAQVEDRLYTMPGPQTAMGCRGPAAAQEDAANAIFRAAPTVTRGRHSVLLSGGGHTMELVRSGPAPEHADSPTAWQGTALSGQSYVIQEVNGQRTDGKRLFSKSPPRLRFGKGDVTMTLDCPKPAKGVFNQGTEHLYGALFDPTCDTPGTRDAALSKIIGADPRVVSGPNGELLLASKAGWAILWHERRDRPK